MTPQESKQKSPQSSTAHTQLTKFLSQVKGIKKTLWEG
jgi:hypothetical protein